MLIGICLFWQPAIVVYYVQLLLFIDLANNIFSLAHIKLFCFETFYTGLSSSGLSANFNE